MAAKKKSLKKASSRRRAATTKAPARKAARKGRGQAKRSTSRRAKSTSTDRPVIVYIHGIGEHPPEEEFKRAWDLALFGRDMGAGTRMAYWSDILHGDSRKRSKKARSARSSRPAPLEAAALLKEANLDPSDEETLAFVESLAASLGRSRKGNGSHRGVRSKALPLPGVLRRPLAEKLLRWFVKDTATYFFDKQVRKRIKDRLVKSIPAGDEPFILVSHSQGTIVAFEVLSEIKRRADAELFVTLGSPLGILEIQDLLEPGGRLRIPSKVRAWHNFADRLDPVALDATLSSEFEPTGQIRDHRVLNQRTKELLGFNPHSSLGYLANPSVRSVVHHAYRFDSSSRFVVARDVAEGFADEETRQPVLIEALHPQYGALGESEDQRKDREGKQPKKQQELAGRIDYLARTITDELARRARRKQIEPEGALKQAKVQRLRKYVAAHLTPEEITELARHHDTLNVYAVWRSARKRKLVTESIAATKVDAGRVSYSAQGQGINWAVLDTGVRGDHPHLAGTVIEVLDCTETGDTPVLIETKKSRDRDGHGTHVSGIIAGESIYEGKKVRGVAPLAKLIVYKVLDDDGAGEDAWIIKAIDDIYRRNDEGAGLQIHGVNLSLGGPFDATVYGCGHSPICVELRDLWRQGVVVCVAAGNEGQLTVLTDDGETDLNTQLSIGDPANLEDCIAVGSVNGGKPHLFGTSWFSSRGPTADGRAKPDVVAPGERVLSANAHAKSGKNKYLRDSGTSMACPHVSGLLAAFLSVRREFRGRPDEVKQILMENCNDLGRDRYHQGAGLPNLMKMLLNT